MDIESIHTRKETLLSLNVFGSTYLLRNHGMIYEDGSVKKHSLCFSKGNVAI